MGNGFKSLRPTNLLTAGQEQISIVGINPKLTNSSGACWFFKIRTRSHIHSLRVACIGSVADSELAEVVPPPAHDTSSIDECTRMEVSQRQGRDRNTCEGNTPDDEVHPSKRLLIMTANSDD
jgi:hypothetical protein